MSPDRLVLLRHGRTAWNAERRFQGQLDPPLDDVGRTQSHEVAPLIAAFEPRAIVASDLRRAAQTATVVGAFTGVPVRFDPRLRERDLGHWQGLTRDDVAARFPAEYAQWVAGREVLSRGGESRAEVAQRAATAFAELTDGGTVVLVSHGATSMALAAVLLGLPQRQHVLGPLANCHWSELTSIEAGVTSSDGDRGWRLRAHNVGVAGVVVPLPVHPRGQDEITDADA